VIFLKKNADDAFAPFSKLSPPLADFRDASYGPCTYKCTVTLRFEFPHLKTYLNLILILFWLLIKLTETLGFALRMRLGIRNQTKVV
jgi:hypothetical protein